MYPSFHNGGFGPFGHGFGPFGIGSGGFGPFGGFWHNK
jgi:hypothetical protein